MQEETNPIDLLTLTLVVAAGVYLLVLGVMLLRGSESANRFLLGFASSALTHYVEVILRIGVGASLIWQAQRFPYPQPFGFFGWLLAITSMGLLLIPWRWHHRYAELTVPAVLRYSHLFGGCSFALGAALVITVAATRF